MRVFLAALLVVTSFPAQAADPLVELLVTHRAAAESFEDGSADDSREAAGEPDPQTLDLGRLANLQSGLSMMAQGIEAFRHPSHYAEARKVLMKRLPQEVQPYYEDRDRGLDTLYRTLALVDYTAALRYESPPCEARALRKALLHGSDGLFVDPTSGAYSPWLKSILRRAKAGPAEAAQRASAAEKLSGVEYDRALARAGSLSDELRDPNLAAEKRVASYCARAAIYESLAAAHRIGVGLVEAGRALEPSARFADALAAVGFIEGPRGAAAVTMVNHSGRAAALTSARMLLDPETGSPDDAVTVGFQDGSTRHARVARWDLESDLALLELDPPPASLILVAAVARRADRVYAVGHPEQGGRWSVTQGLVTRTTASAFQTDALIAAGSAGGPVLDEDGVLVGLGRVVENEDGSLEAGEGVKASAIGEWLARTEESDSHEPTPANSDAPEDWGTGAILTAASTGIAYSGVHIEAGIPGVCVAYCDGPPSSSYSSGGSSGGGEAIVGMAMVLGVAVAGVGYLLWQGLKALAKAVPKSAPRFSKSGPSKASPPLVTKNAPTAAKPAPRPKPTLSLRWDAPRTVRPGEERRVSVKVISDQRGVDLGGIEISVAVSSTTQLKLKTDRDGVASFVLRVSTREQDFEELSRQSQLTVAAAQLLPTLTLAVASGGSIALTASAAVPPFALAIGALAAGCVIYIAADAALEALVSPPAEPPTKREARSPTRAAGSLNAVHESADKAQDDLSREESLLSEAGSDEPDPDDDDESCSEPKAPESLIEFEKAVAGTTRKKFIEGAGGRERAKELFRRFDVKGIGARHKLRDVSGGGRAVAGEMSDGTPIRIRFKPDGTTRIQVGCKKFVFPTE